MAHLIAIRGIPDYLRHTVRTFLWKTNRHYASRLSQDVEAVIINPDRDLDILIEEVRFAFRTLTLAEEVKLVRDPKTLNEPGD